MEQDEPLQEPPWVVEAEARAAAAEARVAAQVTWITELCRLHYDTTEATATLIALTDQLLCCYEELGLHQDGGRQQARSTPDTEPAAVVRELRNPRRYFRSGRRAGGYTLAP